VQIELAKTVATQPAAAFAVLADIVDWPQIISSIRNVELLTPGPIRAGTRLREDRIVFGHEATQDLEVETIERPHRLRLLVEHPDLHYELDHLIDGIYGGGCRLMLIFRSRPRTAPGETLQPLMTPFMEIALRDELEQDLSDLAAALARED
jgi:hypothetical protein